MARPVYVVLLHYPIINRHNEVITTSVTNLDLHDISRSARTYGCQGYYVVTPVQDQHELIGRILGHWGKEASQVYHPDRVEAISRVRLKHTFQEVLDEISKRHAVEAGTGVGTEIYEKPEVVLTDARSNQKSVTYRQLREELHTTLSQRPLVIVYGTGWGVAPEFFAQVDRILAPIYGPGGPGQYNHLSVRAAAAVILDRLFGV